MIMEPTTPTTPTTLTRTILKQLGAKNVFKTECVQNMFSRNLEMTMRTATMMMEVMTRHDTKIIGGSKEFDLKQI